MSEKPRNGVKEINKVCKSVLKLQHSDFEELNSVITQQNEYNHPLKMGTVGWQRDLGNHNQRVLDALITLRSVILEGKDITKP